MTWCNGQGHRHRNTLAPLDYVMGSLLDYYVFENRQAGFLGHPKCPVLTGHLGPLIIVLRANRIFPIKLSLEVRHTGFKRYGKSEEQKRCDSSELGSDSAFALRSRYISPSHLDHPRQAVKTMIFVLEHLPAVDACFACATDIERYTAKEKR